ncbi:MAG: DNA cytosine methyltransferase [Bacteroidia bacterium]
MNILELFSGSRSIGKEAEKLSMRVFSTDVEPFANIDLVKDIRNVKYSDVPFIPDVIWASPPCTSFSILSCRFHWKKEGEVYTPKTEKGTLGILLVQKTLSIIRHYQKLNPNLIWYIENPRGLLRKMPIMQHLLRHTVTYCQYGDTRMKPTDIWTNNTAWRPKAMCKNGSPCHIACPRGSSTGTVGLSNSYERSKIPPKLCKELLIAAIIRLRDMN